MEWEFWILGSLERSRNNGNDGMSEVSIYQFETETETVVGLFRDRIQNQNRMEESKERNMELNESFPFRFHCSS